MAVLIAAATIAGFDLIMNFWSDEEDSIRKVSSRIKACDLKENADLLDRIILDT